MPPLHRFKQHATASGQPFCLDCTPWYRSHAIHMSPWRRELPPMLPNTTPAMKKPAALAPALSTGEAPRGHSPASLRLADARRALPIEQFQAAQRWILSSWTPASTPALLERPMLVPTKVCLPCLTIETVGRVDRELSVCFNSTLRCQLPCNIQRQSPCRAPTGLGDPTSFGPSSRVSRSRQRVG